MADQLQVVRNFSLYAGSKKMGVATGHSYDRESGSEIQIGDGIVIGFSVGVKTVSIQASAIVPYAGNDVLRFLEDAYKGNRTVDVGVGVLNGRVHKLKLLVQKINVKTQMKNGECTGDFTFIGGEGDQIG